ncbi:MAG: CDP-glucose 4,6-dehydratase [Zoogloeaceae bacterium]|jgi:CDP-glucose 4,6-dehydratase|nr:CDP-glucose 4,6-dehydratase [Zoogloeaceae bacterium]
MNAAFWQDRRVFITGHTGFKGSWLSLMLSRLGAKITGFALPPPTTPALFDLARAGQDMHSIIADLRDADAIDRAVREARPEIILHLAAQPLVRQSYDDPEETYAVNVMGLVNLLEAARRSDSTRAIVVITSDKCYENREWPWGYRENEALGGHDPYSSSKACAEIVAAAWRSSFFAPEARTHVATARAGNVIGGGDWGKDRLIPDILNAIATRQPPRLRNPEAVRPWQHVLEPLSGYLLLAEKLYAEGAAWAEAWNFGPADADAQSVRQLVETLAQHWPDAFPWEPETAAQPHEAGALRLDSSKARARLGWRPRWNLRAALARVAHWHQAWQAGEDMRAVTLAQIAAFEQEPSL